MSKTQFPAITSSEEKSFARAGGYRPTVLVVDDEVLIADTIAKILSLRGYAATAAYDGDSALESAMLVPPQLLLTDVVLPGMNGIELAQTVKRIYPECGVLLLSGQASTVDLMATVRRAGHEFMLLNKPVPPDQLLALVAQHLNQSAN
jgi:DNA-binding response OmpR family regulator